MRIAGNNSKGEPLGSPCFRLVLESSRLEYPPVDELDELDELDEPATFQLHEELPID